MDLQTLVLEPARPAVASIVMLHGLGADGTDFLPLADELDLSALGPVRWVLPRAPVRPVTINNGYRMRAWYDILATDLARREDEAGLRASAAQVLELLDREVAHGMPARRIVLAGFSQGAAISLLAGLRCPQRLAGLAGLSGYLPLADAALAEAHAAQRDVPVFLAHGRDDAVVSLERGQAARQSLQAAGWPVQWQDYPMEHTLCIEEVRHLQSWLLQVLASPGP
jgi:phospholipase/carboxylesterase